MDQRKTVAFFGTCSAASSLVLVCKRISTPFTFKGLRAKFAQGCENLLSLRFYYSESSDAPASGAPNGTSLLADYGQVDYLTGDDDVKEAVHEVELNLSGLFLKVYAVNNDTFDHSVDVQMFIELGERG